MICFDLNPTYSHPEPHLGKRKFLRSRSNLIGVLLDINQGVEMGGFVKAIINKIRMILGRLILNFYLFLSWFFTK